MRLSFRMAHNALANVPNCLTTGQRNFIVYFFYHLNVFHSPCRPCSQFLKLNGNSGINYRKQHCRWTYTTTILTTAAVQWKWRITWRVTHARVYCHFSLFNFYPICFSFWWTYYNRPGKNKLDTRSNCIVPPILFKLSKTTHTAPPFCWEGVGDDYSWCMMCVHCAAQTHMDMLRKAK